ncbi:MAG: hypothetical protein J9259_09385 [Thermoplasmata archaeon YP2-bin.285]|jgi:hypothetical protein|uniref:Uncharacterized protein n=1 Tax=Candidatus Sysuiplasma superficiale TaxID=2823368 RepID=A0A8J7YRS4_9ARCH|nr:hypothetical protein [Candidatus Sysuiplasma superficiale]
MSLGKTQVRAHERETADGRQHVRAHMRKTPSSPHFSEELPPEEYDVTATVEGSIDEKGNVKDLETTKVEVRKSDKDG